MKVYQSFEEIDEDLKRHNLERQIALEELKLTKNQISEDLAPMNWLDTFFKLFYKYGFWILIKRLFKKL